MQSEGFPLWHAVEDWLSVSERGSVTITPKPVDDGVGETPTNN